MHHPSSFIHHWRLFPDTCILENTGCLLVSIWFNEEISMKAFQCTKGYLENSSLDYKNLRTIHWKILWGTHIGSSIVLQQKPPLELLFLTAYVAFYFSLLAFQTFFNSYQLNYAVFAPALFSEAVLMWGFISSLICFPVRSQCDLKHFLDSTALKLEQVCQELLMHSKCINTTLSCI